MQEEKGKERIFVECCPMPEGRMGLGIELRVAIRWVKAEEETSPLFFPFFFFFFFTSRAVLKQILVSFVLFLNRTLDS